MEDISTISFISRNMCTRCSSSRVFRLRLARRSATREVLNAPAPEHEAVIGSYYIAYILFFNTVLSSVLKPLWSSVKTLAASAGGRGFEPHRGHKNLFFTFYSIRGECEELLCIMFMRWNVSGRNRECAQFLHAELNARKSNALKCTARDNAAPYIASSPARGRSPSELLQIPVYGMLDTVLFGLIASKVALL